MKNSTAIKKSNTLDMTQGSIAKNLLKFSIPLILTSLLQLAFNAADIIVVGQFADPSISSNAVASIGATAPLINLLVNLFLGLSTGATVVIAKYYGAKLDNDLSQTVHTSILLSLICGLLLTIIGIFGAKYILIWMQTPQSVLPLATKYLQIYFAGNVVTMLYNFGSGILRAVGDTKRPLIFLAISGVANVGFNLFFVLVLNMSVEGVALGTLISQSISAVLIMICLTREDNALRLQFKKLKLHKHKLLNIIRIGLPAGIQSSLFSLSNIFIQSSINSFGEITMAGNSATGNLEGFAYVFMNAFHHASISCASQNLGAGKVDRIKKTLIISPIIASISGIIACSTILLLARPLLGLYLTDQLAIEEGMVRMYSILPIYFILGIMDGISGVIRGAGFAIYPTIVNLIGVCGLRILWIFTVFAIPEYHTIPVLFLSWPLSWIFVIIALLIFYFAYARAKIVSMCQDSKSETQNNSTNLVA